MSAPPRPASPLETNVSRSGYDDSPWTQISDVSNALKADRLNAATRAVHSMCGYGVADRVAQFGRIVNRLVEINDAGPLSAEHTRLNYTLDAAHSLACQMYSRAYEDRRLNSQFMSYRDSMQSVRAALWQIAQVHAKQGNYPLAVSTLTRLEEDGRGLLGTMHEQWRGYIDTQCPADQREKQRALLQSSRIECQSSSQRRTG